MAKHLETGTKGEKAAADYLRKKGYYIMATNWKDDRKEIDIIARQGDIIVFVEVKTRSSAGHGWPEEAVSEQKIELLAEAAETFLLEKRLDNEIRFDIVSIMEKPGGQEIFHILDAFAPGE